MNFLNEDGYVTYRRDNSPDYPFNPNPTATVFYKLEHYRNDNLLAQTISSDSSKNPWYEIQYTIWEDSSTPEEQTAITESPEFIVDSVTLNEADCLYEKNEK